MLLPLFGCESESAAPPPILQESWKAYVERFVQADGRVIDHSADGITTSEGQAYAMLRAVWIGDRETFDRTFKWAVDNLNSGVRKDHLWAWKWGKDSQGKWQVLDKAFATDADQDAALALILASQVWNDGRYREHARSVLRDLWNLGTIDIAGRRYLLAGDSLCKDSICRINPSYYAPYAYRVFATIDDARDWRKLIDNTYEVLGAVSDLSKTRLPADWVQLDTRTGRITAGSDKDSAFSYDAFRVYWRIELDRELFGEARADRYLRESLPWIATQWEQHQKLPAIVSREGKAAADYESLEMLAALMCAMRNESMHQKLNGTYAQGAWGNKSSYYLQNWAWFGTAVYRGYLGPLELLKQYR